jgi:AcrR family transcriptional regulator
MRPKESKLSVSTMKSGKRSSSQRDGDRFKPTKREANRLDKLDRIKRAAATLFSEQGYDEATTREIAAKAEVALGTLFTYATNKRDLLFLIANDLLDETGELAAVSIQANRSLIDNFIVFCALHYRALGAEPELSKLFLRELLFYDSGTQALRAKENRTRLLHTLARMVGNAHRRGEIELPMMADAIGWVLFSILQAEIRRWIASDDLDFVEGLSHLWSTTALMLNGFSKRPVPINPSRAHIQALLAKL